MLHYNNSLRIWCIGSAPVDANVVGHCVLYQTAPPHRSVSNCGCNSRPQEATAKEFALGLVHGICNTEKGEKATGNQV